MPEPSVSSIAIYQLRVVLCGVSPLVWRRLLVVSETSIAELHQILQNAFGGSGEHLRRFLMRGADYGIPHLGNDGFRERCTPGVVRSLVDDVPGRPSVDATC